jgi:hypothetical protein
MAKSQQDLKTQQQHVGGPVGVLPENLKHRGTGPKLDIKT